MFMCVQIGHVQDPVCVEDNLGCCSQESSPLFYDTGSLTSLELAEYDQQILGICLSSTGIPSVCCCALPFLH